MQTDPLWKNEPYRAPGENSTIGSSGCGPSCAAMLIQTITGKIVTPKTTCDWSMKHGYKALRQGTYYSYFKPQFAAYGIEAYQFNYNNLVGAPKDKTHDHAFDLLNHNHYLIALMKKGHWTSDGHFVVVYKVDDKVRINDPFSNREDRLNGDIQTFRNECAYYFAVNAKGMKGDDDMTIEEFDKMHKESHNRMASGAPGAWSKEARDYCTKNGIFKGDGKGNFDWLGTLTREQAASLIFEDHKRTSK